MALEAEFSAFSGNDITLIVTVVNEDEDGSPALDLTGAQALIWVLAKKQGGNPILTKTLLDGVSIEDAVGGIVHVELTAVESEPLKDDYYHEMRLTNVDGKKSTLMYGAVTISKNSIQD
jgi:hypothetical protein